MSIFDIAPFSCVYATGGWCIFRIILNIDAVFKR